MVTNVAKKVCVVISTYNGEKYLEDQLSSLIEQTYPNMKIFVRDDDSKDNTAKILDKWKESNKIDYVKGKNLGYGKSFVEALKLAGDFDYYAFCDQDDVWLPNKIESAIKILDNKNMDKPLLYVSNLNVCDGDLNFINKTNNVNIISFANSIVEASLSGNTLVFNRKLKEILISAENKNLYAHDWIVYMIASSMGEIYYDKNAYIQYRKHANCVTDQKMGFIKLQIYRIKKGFFSIIKKQTVEFEHNYSKQLSEEDRRLLKLFTNKKYSLITCLKKAFYPHRFRQRIIDEILLRIVFLCGIV